MASRGDCLPQPPTGVSDWPHSVKVKCEEDFLGEACLWEFCNYTVAITSSETGNLGKEEVH